MEVLIQDCPFPLVNLYAPTKSSEQCSFFGQVANIRKDSIVDPDCHVGGNFSTHLNSNLDNLGDRIESIASVKKLKGMVIANDLIDIWRIYNPDKMQFTWTQRNPLIRRRLDFWLISREIQGNSTIKHNSGR